MSYICGTISGEQRLSPNTVKRVIKIFTNFASVKAKEYRCKRVVCNENIEITIWGYFATNLKKCRR